ncbi:MAG: T9SS type A sorting domain-containing protein [Ignavibacteriae bacterium]|nr:T9SS C-terminal target domain-containing protein [Ignavibacteriota bacterium]NOG98042.1 T9SS type A sorting domain-containing protein [Ignavibacteriota bacterium]
MTNNGFCKTTILIFFMVTIILNAQTFKRVIDEIPFNNGTAQLRNVFSGGISGVEHQFADIDGDNDFDLFYLNSDGSFEFMENKGTVSQPNFFISQNRIEGLNLRKWFYFLDIDSDEDLDLFIGGEGNTISLLKNIGTKFNPDFIIEIDTVKDDQNDILFSDNVSNPVFGDIDNDGDFDFFLGTQNGSVTFYENIGSSSSFNFKFITSTWQNISIIGGGKILHGASSLEMKDIDNDLDLDVIWGDFFSRSLYYLENMGTPQIPNIKLLYESYPQNEDSVFTRGFNMPRLTDIDADGDYDLFVSVLFDPTVPQTLMYYENQGSAAVPDFRKITDDYFSTLDVGTKSVPAFVDIDDDGDRDLFIGNEKFLTASIYFYENTGINSNEFTLRDTAFFDISSPLSLAPTFGDIDGDDDFDLVVGNFQGKCFLYRNTGSSTVPNFIAEGTLKDNLGAEIQFSTFLRPQLTDIDFDNDLDLVLGGFNGEIELYENTGTSGEYTYSLVQNYFSGIDVGDLCSPYLIDYDLDNDLDLFIGSRGGLLFYYSNDGNSSQPQFNLISENFIDFNFGKETAPYLVDLDGDTDLDLFVGNVKGGLYYFKNQTAVSIKQNDFIEPINEFNLSTYPNPFNSSVKINVRIKNADNYSLSIYDILGKNIGEIFKGELKEGEHKFGWDAKNLSGLNVPSGVYFIALTNNSIVRAKRVLLIK